jgi:hypothetical protein
MISTADLVYGVDLKLNKVSGLAHQSIPVEDKIIAFNNAQLKLIKKKLSTNNVLGLGLDGNKKRYEDLDNLIEPANKHQLTLELTDKYLNKWSSGLTDLRPNYMFFVDGYLIADKGQCRDKIIYINSELVKHGNVTTLLNNPSYIPSFEYQETFCTLSSDLIEVYTDGSFSPKALYLSYIRYPVIMDYEGYVHSDGSESKLVNCELKAYLEEELLDLAILELGIETENPVVMQAAQIRNQSAE